MTTYWLKQCNWPKSLIEPCSKIEYEIHPTINDLESTMLETALKILNQKLPADSAEAHCDGPCGVYDPASARIAAEAGLSMHPNHP